MSNIKTSMEWVLIEDSEATATHSGRRTDLLQVPTGVLIRTVITTLDRSRSLMPSVALCLVPFAEINQTSDDVRLKSLYAEHMAVAGMAGAAAGRMTEGGR